jgi:tellurite resistance protein TerC
MLWLWTGLLGLLVALIAVELGLLTRRPRVITPAEALVTALLWGLTAVGLGLAIDWVYDANLLNLRAIVTDAPPLAAGAQPLKGDEAVVQFFTAYVTELALTLDNIAVLLALFTYFKVPPQLVARVLFWGIVLTLLLRLGLILIAGALATTFSWFVYVFALLLLVAMLRTLLLPDIRTDFSRRWVVRTIRRFVPIGPMPQDHRLFTRLNGKLALTPLALVVLTAGVADLTYAADSIPAAFSITSDPFIAFAAQAMAILALRSLYFALAGVVRRFRYMKLTLVAIMGYIVVKTLAFRQGELATEITLMVVSGLLLLGAGCSFLSEMRRARAQRLATPDAPDPVPIEDLAEAAAAAKRNFRKVMILIAGTVVILFGIAITPLPGPGPTVLVPIGVAILATEFVWAQALFRRGKDLAQRATNTSDRISKSLPRWIVIPALLGFYGFWAWLAYWAHYSDPPKTLWRNFAFATAFGLSFPVLGWAYRLVFRKGQSLEIAPLSSKPSQDPTASPSLQSPRTPPTHTSAPETPFVSREPS